MRSAAFEAAGPQPGVIGGEQRDAALAAAVEHQQRTAFGAFHQRAAAVGLDLGLAEPAAPGRIAIRVRRVGAGRPCVTGWRKPSLVILALNGSSSTRPVGEAGRIGDSGVR